MEIIYSLLPGTILKGQFYTYRIERTLGQGSFGITYLASVKMAGALGAIDAKINVAIKEFFMRDINGRTDTNVTSGSNGGIYEDYKKKFKREALNLSILQHPNIVKVIESFEANNTVYYVMEYIGGGSLDDYILKGNGLKVDEAIKIAVQIGSALSYMHAQGMLHLDLKPSNIMMKESGDVVLIDFGLSKQYNSKGEPESSTKVGAGTPGYAPIEQANYREGKDFPVTMDVYAFGATMFKMLTGVRPPEASDILNEGFPFYEFQDKNISHSLSACIAKAMAPIKKDRMQTVSDFVTSLENANTFVYEGKTVVDPEKEKSRDPDRVTDRVYDILKPRKDTDLVTLEYYPSFHSGETERIYEISSHHFRCLGKGTRYEISISQDNFKYFLTELEQLNIKVYPEGTEREDWGTDNTRIKISLFEKDGGKYQTLWKYLWTDEYGGGENGNLTETPKELFEKICNILPPRLNTVDEADTEEGYFRTHPDTDSEPVDQPSPASSAPKSTSTTRSLWPYIASIAGALLCMGLGILLPRGCNGTEVDDSSDSPILSESEPAPAVTSSPILSESEPAPVVTSQTITANGVSFKMICVEGASSGTFFIGETEVTQALWLAVMGTNPSKFKGENLPVERVSWDDCKSFISELNSITGKTFRLPWEAEWEYAAKGGNKSRGYEYSGSNTLDEVGWYYENSGNSRLDYSSWSGEKMKSNGCCTHPVKQKKPNELGIFDMSGNVCEWCEDLDPYHSSKRMHRGGSWRDSDLCYFLSFCNSPGYRDYGIGLRLAL